MQRCTTHIIEWDSTQESFVELPSNCLSYNIVNEGGSLITVDDSIELRPRQFHPVAYHTGYYHTGKLDIKVTNTQPPYSDKTKVIVRLVVEIDQNEQ
jgi:hypothetical protein